MSLKIIEDTTLPSSTKIAEFVEILCTVAEIDPVEVVMLSLSPTLHVFSQLLIEDLELCCVANGKTMPG